MLRAKFGCSLHSRFAVVEGFHKPMIGYPLLSLVPSY